MVEPTLKSETKTELVDVPYADHPVVESHPLEIGLKEEKSAAILSEEMNPKEDDSGKEGQKVRKRGSLPTKQEFAENISQDTPNLPSYMAATDSAKAKLRAQALSKLSENGIELGYARRH